MHRNERLAALSYHYEAIIPKTTTRNLAKGRCRDLFFRDENVHLCGLGQQMVVRCDSALYKRGIRMGLGRAVDTGGCRQPATTNCLSYAAVPRPRLDYTLASRVDAHGASLVAASRKYATQHA